MSRCPRAHPLCPGEHPQHLGQKAREGWGVPWARLGRYRAGPAPEPASPADRRAARHWGRGEVRGAGCRSSLPQVLPIPAQAAHTGAGRALCPGKAKVPSEPEGPPELPHTHPIPTVPSAPWWSRHRLLARSHSPQAQHPQSAGLPSTCWLGARAQRPSSWPFGLGLTMGPAPLGAGRCLGRGEKEGQRLCVHLSLSLHKGPHLNDPKKTAYPPPCVQEDSSGLSMQHPSLPGAMRPSVAPGIPLFGTGATCGPG